jgi:hypothetical protein
MWGRCCIVAMVAACFSPQPSPGAPCGPGGECPQGLECSNGLCLLGGSDAGAPADGSSLRWALVATAGSEGATTEIVSTGDGHTILVGVETGAAGGATTVGDDGGNTYKLVTASRSVNPGEDNAVEVWFTQNSAGGAKKVTASGPTIHAVVVWELAGISTTNPIAAVTTIDAQATSTAPTGAPITTTESGQFVLSIVMVANSVTGLTANSPFTNDHTTFGNGWAHLTDDAAPPATYQAQWIQPTTGTSCASSVVLNAGP